MDGCVGLSMLADRDTGHCIVTTSWRDEAAMRSSGEDVRPSAERTAELLGGRPELQEWEIAAMHRVDEAHPGVAVPRHVAAHRPGRRRPRASTPSGCP